MLERLLEQTLNLPNSAETNNDVQNKKIVV